MSSRPALVSMSRCGHEDATTTWVLQRLVSSVLNNGGFVKLNVPPTLVFSDMGNRHHHFLQTGDDGYLRLHETCLNDHPQDGPSDWRGALDVFRELNRDCQSCVVRLSFVLVAVLPRFNAPCLIAVYVLCACPHDCFQSLVARNPVFSPGVVCRK